MNLFSRLGIGWQIDPSTLSSQITQGILGGLGGGGGTPTYLTPEQLNQIYKTLSGSALAGFAPQVQNLQTQRALVGPNADIARGQATQQAGFSTQGLGYTSQLAGLTSDATKRQQGELPQQQAWAQQLHGLDVTGNQRAQALSQTQQGFTEAGFGLDRGSLDQQQQQLDYNAQRALQNAMGAQAARGASNTVGGGRELEDLAKQKGWDQQTLDRARSRLGLTQQGEEAGHGAQQAGFTDTGTRLDVAGQQQTQQFGDQGFALAQQLKGEDITGTFDPATGKGTGQLGLQGAQITSGLANQLANIGIGAQSQTNQLDYQLGQTQSAANQAVQGVGNTVAGYATGGYNLGPGMTSADITAILSKAPGAPAQPTAPAQPAQPPKPAPGAPTPGAAKQGMPIK